MRFSDMPEEYRMKARAIIDDNGGMVSMYHRGVQVAMPNTFDGQNNIRQGLEAMGLMPEGGNNYTLTYFPIGGDNPPEQLRHFGPGTAAAPRGDRPSYWMYVNFFLT